MARNPIDEIMKANSAIERNLASSGSRGEIAQDILSHLRNLTEHLAMALTYGESFTGPNYYLAINPALDELPKKGMKFLWEFHKLLQKSVSHYSLFQDGAQRLLLKYKEFLFLCKNLALNELHIDILSGLDNINWNEDPGLQEYYDLIFEKVDAFGFKITGSIEQDRYYVYSRKAVFSKSHLFYEYSLVPAADFTSKFDHIVAFSLDRIPTNYAIAISIKHSSVPALGGTLPIMIIDDWRTSIRPCEINKLLKVLGDGERITGQLNSYKHLMDILTDTKVNLLELCTLNDVGFSQVIASLALSGSKTGIQDLLKRARPFLLSQKPGSNLLRYLLYRPRHSVIQKQVCDTPNNLLSGLYLQYGCIPFDKQPYCTSLIGHSPSCYDLALCINSNEYEDNLLARTVGEKESDSNCVFVSQKELEMYQDADDLIGSYNQALYTKHQGRKLLHEMGQIFFKEAEDDLAYIIKELRSHSNKGIPGYQQSSKAKLGTMSPKLDDERKIEIAENMFDKSRVALLYDSAGTGKTTLVNVICEIFANSKKAAIANTNPAVDNLRRRIKDNLCDSMTITKYLKSDQNNKYDLLIIDECSTVSNSDMKKILSRKKFELLLLVGDTCQIESIRLGNWFGVAQNFLDNHCIFQLERSWRTASADLKNLWDSVRLIKNDIAERLNSCDISKPLCKDIFKKNI